jgi:hypothetical protein
MIFSKTLFTMRIFHHTVKWSRILLGVFLLTWAALSYGVDWQRVAQQQLDILSQDKPLHLTLSGKPSFSLPLAMRLPVLTMAAKNPAALLPTVTLENVRISFSLWKALKATLMATSVQAKRVIFSSPRAQATLEDFKTELLPDNTDVIAVNGSYVWNKKPYTLALRTRFMQTSNAASFAVRVVETNNPQALLQLAGLGVMEETLLAIKFNTITLEKTTMTGQLTLKNQPVPSLEGSFHVGKTTGGQSFFNGQDFAVLSGFLGNGGSNGSMKITLDELTVQTFPFYNAQLNAVFTPNAPIRHTLNAVTTNSAPVAATGLFTYTGAAWALEQLAIKTAHNALSGTISYTVTPTPQYSITLNTAQFTLGIGGGAIPFDQTILDSARALKTPISVSLNTNRLTASDTTLYNLSVAANLTPQRLTLNAFKAESAPQQSLNAKGSLDITGVVPQITLSLAADSAALKTTLNVFGAPAALFSMIEGQTALALQGDATTLALQYAQRTLEESLRLDGTLVPFPTPQFQGTARYQHNTATGAINAVSPLVLNKTGLELRRIEGTIGQGQISGTARLTLGNNSAPPTLDFQLAGNTLPLGYLFLPFFALPPDNNASVGVCADNTKRFDFSGFKRVNGRIQISTQQTTFRTTTLFNTTALYVLENGQLTGRLTTAQQNGNAQLDLAAYTSETGTTLDTRFTLQNMPIAMLPFGGREGLLTATGTTHSGGQCSIDHWRSLAGNAQLALQNITLPIPNLVSAAQILRDNPSYLRLVGAKNSLEPQTPITTANGTVFFGDGRATLQNTTLAFAGGGVRVEGTINLFRRILQLVTLVSFDAMPISTPPLKFTIEGAVESPQVNFSLF